MMASTQIIPFVPVSVDLDYPHLPSMANDYQRWKKFMFMRNVLPPKRLIYLDTRAAQKLKGVMILNQPSLISAFLLPP